MFEQIYAVQNFEKNVYNVNNLKRGLKFAEFWNFSSNLPSNIDHYT